MNKKYFIAILLPEPLLGQVEIIKHELLKEFNLKGALRSPAHITLHRPFEWEEEKEQKLIEVLSEFKFSKEFTITLKNFNYFKPRVIYVDVAQEPILNDLYSSLKYFAQEHLHLLNEVNDERGFHPHVTIAFRDLKKNRFEVVWQNFKEREFRHSFEFKGITLLKLEERWRPLRLFN